jgi:hypothetical protein
MEAKKFGFAHDASPAFKFDPTDADIVAHYLLPRGLGIPNPHAHAIIDDDPRSLPPWDLLAKHGHTVAGDQAVHAFFFGPPTDASKNGGRKGRTVEGGGTWQGQKGADETITLLRPGGGEVDIVYKRYNLTFKHLGRCTGYVMHEYEIVSPPLPGGTVLSRIKFKAPKKAAPPVADAQQAVLHASPTDPKQACPSYGYDAARGEQFAGAQDGYYYAPAAPPTYNLPMGEYDSNYNTAQADVLYGGATGETAGTCYDPSNQYQAEDGYYYAPAAPPRYDPPMGEYDNNNYYNADEMMSCGDGILSAQADGFYGGGTVETASTYCDPSSGVPEYGGKYIDYYGEYQHDPSNQYLQAGDAAVMCEEFISEQSTGALCGNSDNGSVTGTEASADSTISLCDDITFYNMMFGIGGDDNLCEQRDAGHPAKG